MSNAFVCDICNSYFSPEPQYGAHTTLSDNIAGKAPMDICPRCTEKLVVFLEHLRKEAVESGTEHTSSNSE